jgi:hypothetical protein
MVMAISGFKQPFAAISDGCAQVKISGHGVMPCCIILVNPIREVESAKKSKKAKRGAPRARRRDEEGEASQEEQRLKNARQSPSGSDGSPQPPAASTRWHDRRSIDHSVGRERKRPQDGHHDASVLSAVAIRDYRYSRGGSDAALKRGGG